MISEKNVVYLHQRFKDMKERYDLPNRDGDEVWLRQLKDSSYLLDMEHEYPIQITYDSKNKEKIVAVDPSGGPFMYCGYEVEQGTTMIQDIQWVKGLGFVFTLTE